MNVMTDEGFIEEAWEEHRRRNMEVVECKEGALSGTKEDVDVLSIINVGGIFMFHYAFIIIALFTAITSKYFKRREGNGTNLKKKVLKTSQSSDIVKSNIPEITEEESMGDMSDVMKGEVIAYVDKRMSRVDDQMSQIFQLLKQLQ